MPMFKALKACPDAIVVKPNHDKYRAEGGRVREKMQALTPLVEPVSIDEAYMDLKGTEQLNGQSAAASLIQLAADIERDIGITVSIGLAPNKFLAKTASEIDKPRGFAVLGQEEAKTYLGPLSPRAIHGVGPKLAAKLELDGFETIENLQIADVKTLIRRYGETGLWLHQRANGVDNRPVQTNSVRKSVSSETTFAKDISNAGELSDVLWRVCLQTADRAKSAGVEGRVITLKLKTKQFQTITRRVSLTVPTQLAQVIFRTAKPMLMKEVGNSYRLLGVGLSSLEPAKGDAADLLDPSVKKRADAERAADIARERFGADAIKTGRGMKADIERKKK